MLSQEARSAGRGVFTALAGIQALVLGVLEGALAVLVPAIVELALVLVRPFPGDLVRPVARAAGPVHEERLVRLERLVPPQVVDRVVGEVFAQVVIIVSTRGMRMLDVGRVSHQARRAATLRRQGTRRSTQSRSPRASNRKARRRSSAPRACCAICRTPRWRSRTPSAPWPPWRCSGNDAGVAIPIVGQLGDLAAGDAVMVPAAQERRARVGEHMAVVWKRL